MHGKQDFAGVLKDLEVRGLFWIIIMDPKHRPIGIFKRSTVTSDNSTWRLKELGVRGHMPQSAGASRSMYGKSNKKTTDSSRRHPEGAGSVYYTYLVYYNKILLFWFPFL